MGLDRALADEQRGGQIANRGRPSSSASRSVDHAVLHLPAASRTFFAEIVSDVVVAGQETVLMAQVSGASHTKAFQRERKYESEGGHRSGESRGRFISWVRRSRPGC